MPNTFVNGSSVVQQDKIYLLGGDENCCMSYDPEQDQWSVLAKPGVNHCGGSAVVWKNRILLCGGSGTSVIEEYDPDADNWVIWKHEMPQMMNCRATFSLRL